MTVTYTVIGELGATKVVARLLWASQWFEVMPLPDDWWEFKVKLDAEPILRQILTDSGCDVRKRVHG